jgi:hypothetical protein
VVVYRATLDVPAKLAWFVPSCWPPSGTAAAPTRGSRALTCFWQPVRGLRWFHDRTSLDAPIVFFELIERHDQRGNL